MTTILPANSSNDTLHGAFILKILGTSTFAYKCCFDSKLFNNSSEEYPTRIANSGTIQSEEKKVHDHLPKL